MRVSNTTSRFKCSKFPWSGFATAATARRAGRHPQRPAIRATLQPSPATFAAAQRACESGRLTRATSANGTKPKIVKGGQKAPLIGL